MNTNNNKQQIEVNENTSCSCGQDQSESNLKTHAELGNQLDLFFFDEKSPGSAFFLPAGAILYNNLLSYFRSEYMARGYQEVLTPNIFDKSLWETSGHWDKYKENMFIIEKHHPDDVSQFSIKPMNCPSHCLMFKHVNPSYRQLPMRLADFGVLHRNEFHGALRGLTRVRKFSQDDAHIFCSMDQIEDEIKGVIDFIKQVYKIFNFKFSVGLSTRPEKYIGSIDNWNKAEEILSRLITTFDESNINPGDGAFYGPKLDFTVTDTLGRKHQLGTIQLDFNLPERFNLTYQDDQGALVRPVIIHRAILGSVERFIALLLENGQGDIPYFVSPRQICIIPVSVKPDLVEYCDKVKTLINTSNAGKYVNVDLSSETLQKKILNAEMLHYNYIIVLGKKELGASTVNIRGIGEKSQEYLIKMLLDENKK